MLFRSLSSLPWTTRKLLYDYATIYSPLPIGNTGAFSANVGADDIYVREGKININTASRDVLLALPFVGETTDFFHEQFARNRPGDTDLRNPV